MHKNYNPDLDFNAKVEELRSNWEELQQRKVEEKASQYEIEDIDEEDDELTPELRDYFSRTPSASTLLTLGRRGNVMVDEDIIDSSASEKSEAQSKT